MAYFPSDSTFQQLELNENINLVWPFTFDEGIEATDITDVISDQDGRIINLPDATLTSSGQNLMFNNISNHSFEITAFDGTTNIATLAAGEVKVIYLYNIETSNGLWRVIPFGNGTNSIVALSVSSEDNSMLITNPDITPPGGTIDVALPISINNLNNISSVGFPVIKSTEPIVWGVDILENGNNILINNPNGSLGNPQISLNPILENISSISVSDCKLSGSELIATTENGTIQISSLGTGNLSLNGVNIDRDRNISNINNIQIDGVLENNLIPKAWVMFTDTIIGASNSIVKESASNISTITGSNGSYIINFSTSIDNDNYAVSISLGSTEAIPTVYSAFWTLRTTSSVSIAVVDSSGELVSSTPHGVSVTIMSI